MRSANLFKDPFTHLNASDFPGDHENKRMLKIQWGYQQQLLTFVMENCHGVSKGSVAG